MEKANPESYITPDDPPVFIQHGTLDNWVPVQQSIDYAAKLTPILGEDKVYLQIMEGAAHGGVPFNNENNVGKVLDFLDQTLQSSLRQLSKSSNRPDMAMDLLQSMDRLHR